MVRVDISHTWVTARKSRSSRAWRHRGPGICLLCLLLACWKARSRARARASAGGQHGETWSCRHARRTDSLPRDCLASSMFCLVCLISFPKSPSPPKRAPTAQENKAPCFPLPDSGFSGWVSRHPSRAARFGRLPARRRPTRPAVCLLRCHVARATPQGRLRCCLPSGACEGTSSVLRAHLYKK